MGKADRQKYVCVHQNVINMGIDVFLPVFARHSEAFFAPYLVPSLAGLHHTNNETFPIKGELASALEMNDIVV
jgi:hypothetical protein